MRFYEGKLVLYIAFENSYSLLHWACERLWYL